MHTFPTHGERLAPISLVNREGIGKGEGRGWWFQDKPQDQPQVDGVLACVDDTVPSILGCGVEASKYRA